MQAWLESAYRRRRVRHRDGLRPARRGHEVVLWAREPEVVDTVNAKRENAVFLRGVTLPEGIVATGEMAAAARGSEFVLLVPPAQHMRAVTASLQPHLAAGTCRWSAARRASSAAVAR
jgi:glycerol-3-phosphate dehydrogenase (NAD(P)+)